MDFEITKREILFSVSIISLFLLIGIFITHDIREDIIDRNEVFNKSLQIVNHDLFKYAMETNVGNSFVYGKLKAIDGVTNKDLDNNYMYIKKVTEEYTPHTRTVRYKCGKSTCTRTEVYWTWDEIDTKIDKSEKVKFLNIEFTTDHFNLPYPEYLKTKTYGDTRYKYYVIPMEIKGTIFTNLKDKTMSKNNKFYKDMTIEQTYTKLVKDDSSIYLTWVIIIIITAATVYIFYKAENKWLY